ncbi:MAG TPA: ATP-binding protein [Terriglobales bacterium]|nr:ATP-binding protein [Terriglobales bacterium]
MRRLFVKIFLCYWLAQALFFILAILVASALRPSREISNLQAQQVTFLSEALQTYQTGGETPTWKYLRSIHDAHHVHLYILNEAGKDILGRNTKEWVQRAQRGGMSTADTFWGRFRPIQFLRASTTGPDGHRYTIITELVPDPHPWFFSHGPGIGILIGIISSGLVCYLLARYLTSPIVRLRAATQKLAGGDLSARAGVPTFGGHDETAELMRDFDRMAERIQNLVAAQRRLLTDISHELRSPLARLNVALELARQRSGAEAAGALERIDRESTRLNEMIQRLLTLARLEGGEDSLEKCPVDLEQLIREIAKDASFEAQSRRLHVEVDVAENCVVHGSPSLLHSAIENVVRNAIRYTEEGTSVQIQLERSDALPLEAIVRVTDSGPGVPEDALDKLFRPFYRIDDARGRQTGGVGLGLSITARAVSLCGGSVEARNRTQGGLIIEIRLPLVTTELPQDAVLEVPVPVSGGDRT